MVGREESVVFMLGLSVPYIVSETAHGGIDIFFFFGMLSSIILIL